MYKEHNEERFIIEVLRSFSVVFTITVLAMILAGFLISHFAPEIQNISTLFAFSKIGFSYSSILQITGLSFFLSFFQVILLYRFFIKMKFLIRFIIFSIASIFTISIFSIFFKWFPVDNILAWILFLINIIICFIIGYILQLLKFKLGNRKYNKLLDNYNAQHNNLK